MSNPFAHDAVQSGHGLIHLALLPPRTSSLKTVQYQYPLKLISPAPTRTHDAALVHTVYLLTYGGGLVAGDTINLKITIETDTKLVLLTQGSTKLFKSPHRSVVSHQHMHVKLEPGSALCYLPDPVQPFKDSCFEQRQIYQLTAAPKTGSLCVLDWVCNGRAANGEDWSFHRYHSCNEIVLQDGLRERLLLRDSLTLDRHEEELTQRMHKLKVVGTLLLSGPMMQSLSSFFMTEFKEHPRIGGRQWDVDDELSQQDAKTQWRNERYNREMQQGMLWSVASVRGCTVIKFGALEVEHGRRWLYDMLTMNDTITRCFGERALLCLK